jgi:hypothetical protein
MKIDRNVLRETRFVALGTLFFSALEQLVFLAFGAYGLAVLFGTLLSAALGILNFFLLGLTVQKVLTLGGDEAQAKGLMKLSRSVRTFGMLAVLAVGVLLDCFSTVAVLVTVFFPRVTIFIRQLMIRRAARGEVYEALPEETEGDDDRL